MTRLAMNKGDRDLLKMISLSKKDNLILNNTMRDLGFEGKKIEELSSEELNTLENALKFRDEFIGTKGIRKLQ